MRTRWNCRSLFRIITELFRALRERGLEGKCLNVMMECSSTPWHSNRPRIVTTWTIHTCHIRCETNPPSSGRTWVFCWKPSLTSRDKMAIIISRSGGRIDTRFHQRIPNLENWLFWHYCQTLKHSCWKGRSYNTILSEHACLPAPHFSLSSITWISQTNFPFTYWLCFPPARWQFGVTRRFFGNGNGK
jgi:hypothetical protein